MNIADLGKQLSVYEDQTVSGIVPSFQEPTVDQIFVLDKSGRLKGYVTAHMLVGKPSSTTMSSLTQPCASLDFGWDLIDAVELVLGTKHLRGVPVTKDDKLVDVVDPVMVLRQVKETGLLDDRTVGELSSERNIIIDENSNLEEVENILKKDDYESLVVVNSHQEPLGLASGNVILGQLVGPTHSVSGGHYGRGDRGANRTSPKESTIGSLHLEPLVLSTDGTTLNSLVDSLVEKKALTSAVTSNGKVIRVLTYEDILRYAFDQQQQQNGLHVQIRGASEVNESDRDKYLSYRAIRQQVQKIAELPVKISSAHLDIQAGRKEGERQLYTLKTRLKTNIGLYTAEVEGWEFVTLVHALFDKVYKQVKKDIRW